MHSKPSFFPGSGKDSQQSKYYPYLILFSKKNRQQLMLSTVEDCEKGQFERFNTLLKTPLLFDMLTKHGLGMQNSGGALYQIIVSIPSEHSSYVLEVLQHPKVVELLLNSKMADAYFKRIFEKHVKAGMTILFYPQNKFFRKISQYLWKADNNTERWVKDITFTIENDHEALKVMQTKFFLDRLIKTDAEGFYLKRIFEKYSNAATMILKSENEITCEITKIFWKLDDAPQIYAEIYQGTMQTMREVMAQFVCDMIVNLPSHTSKNAVTVILDDKTSIVDLINSSKSLEHIAAIFSNIQEILKHSEEVTKRIFSHRNLNFLEQVILELLFTEWPVLQEVAKAHNVSIGDRNRYPDDDEETMRVVSQIILSQLCYKKPDEYKFITYAQYR